MYQPIYLAETENELLLDHPLFQTKEEAWDYIHQEFCQCQYFNKGDYCEMCEAEWLVDKV
jgi:hypothetical protein